MSPSYFDQLEDELREAVPRAAGGTPEVAGEEPGSRSPRRRRWTTGPLLALNALVVAGVAVALIVVLGHNHSGQPAAKPATTPLTRRRVNTRQPNDPAASVPTLEELLANFATLRRPQTAADRSWKPDCGCGTAATQLSRYTRLARRLPGGDRLFFDLERFNIGGQDNLPAGAVSMEYDLVQADGNVDSVPFDSGDYDVYASPVVDNLFVSVAPDGVSTVTWRFTCRGKASACTRVHPFDVTVPVIDNIAVKRITRHTCPSLAEIPPRQRRGRAAGLARTTGCETSMQTIWRNASGKVVASFPQGFGNLAAAPFVKGARPARILPDLGPEGIGDAQIGQRASSAVSALDRLLGRRTVREAKIAGCANESEVIWTSPAVASPLTIYMRSGRFVGYRYGAPVNEIGLVRGPGAVLTTARGLGLDETVGQASRVYGPAFHAHAFSGGLHGNGGGVWTGSGDGGTLGGALLPVRYPMTTVTASNPIATIVAGRTGCP